MKNHQAISSSYNIQIYFMRVLLIMILILSPFFTWAQASKENIHLEKTLDIATDGTVEINNQYGKLQINTWNNDSVKFEINFQISEKNEAQLNKMKENVHFEFLGDKKYRIASCLFNDSYHKFLKSIKETTNIETGESLNSQINITVTLPSHMKLVINHKYGKVYIPNYDGDISLNLSNGNVKAYNLNGNNAFNLSYGKANIEHVKLLSLKLNFFDATINQVETLNFTSKSSDVKVLQSEFINFNSTRGNLSFMNTNRCSGNSEFSNLTIMQLNHNASLNMSYSTLKQLNLSNSCTNVLLNCQNTPITIKLDTTPSYLLDIIALKSPLNNLADINWEEPKFINDKGTTQVNGKKEGTNSSTLIKIEAKYSKISIE